MPFIFSCCVFGVDDGMYVLFGGLVVVVVVVGNLWLSEHCGKRSLVGCWWILWE